MSAAAPRRSWRRRVVPAAVAVAVMTAAALLPACSLSSAPAGYDLKATFSRAIGLYPNSSVRVQGISVGEVTEIKPMGNRVLVTMRIEHGKKIPADATAALVPASLLGERYVQLAPVYTGGPALQPGAEIHHTKIPAEFDELLRSLQNFTGSIDPRNASDLITNLSKLLDGQGQSLNNLIDSGAGTLKLLADKSGALGDIVDSLSTLTTALQGHTGEIENLVRDYNALAGVLSDNTGNLNRTITSLDDLATEITDLLANHASQLPFEVEQLTHVTRTVDRNFDSLQTLLYSTVRLFSAAGRGYNADLNALNLNSQGSPSFTGELIAYRLRDRLSGLCRRLAIASCGDPATSPFNSIVSQIPGLLGKLANDSGPAGGASAQPSAPQAQQSAPPSAPPSPAPPPGPNLPAPKLNLSTLNLSAEQRAAVDNLTRNVLPVLEKLDSDQLLALLSLTPEQITALGKLPLDQIPAALTQIRAGSLTPDALLRPVLPPLPGTSGNASLNDLADALLGAVGTVGGR